MRSRRSRPGTADALLLAVVAVGVLVVAKLVAVADAAERHSRSLVFRPGRVQVIIGFGIPLSLPHQSVTTGMLLKSNYLTPSNVSMYTRPQEYFSSRSARAAANAPDAGGLTEHLASRWDLYTALQGTLEQLGGGAGSGRQCLLRAVCEAAAFTVRHDGLLGELLHVLLTPSTTRERVLLHQDHEFHAAEAAGRRARAAQDPVDTCARTFRGCATSTLDMFSRIHDFRSWPIN